MNGGPGLHAPARFVAGLVCAAAFAALPTGTLAQAPAQPAPSAAAPIERLLVDKLVWSTMAALDHANQTGNYSVLRDLGAPSFQTNNSAATLGGIFETIRNLRLDLSNTLLVVPTYEAPPAIQGGLLRARGVFPLRPVGISFDLLFQNVNGQWRLIGISVAPIDTAVRPAPAPARTPNPAPPTRR